MRVASSDWCASRIVVSVSSTRCWALIHCAKVPGPRLLSSSRVPAGAGCVRSQAGLTGAGSGKLGKVRPFISGWPLTLTSPRYFSSLVARSRRGATLSSSGVWSMKRVVHSPLLNCGCAITFSRKARLVATPRMRNSRSERSMRAIASSELAPQAVTLTSRLS